jgi:hypothetical protein
MKKFQICIYDEAGASFRNIIENRIISKRYMENK